MAYSTINFFAPSRGQSVKKPLNFQCQPSYITFCVVKSGPFSIYEQPKYKPNLTLILTQILTLKPTWVDATIRSHFGCSYIEKEPKNRCWTAVKTFYKSLFCTRIKYYKWHDFECNLEVTCTSPKDVYYLRSLKNSRKHFSPQKLHEKSC